MPNSSTPPDDFVRRDKQINVRIDAELYQAAMDRAYEYGLGAVIRALLRAYVRGETKVNSADLKVETTTAPRQRRPRARKPTKK